MTQYSFVEDDVLIRLADRGLDFVYTVRQGAQQLDTATVSPGELLAEDGYYGGSQVMD